MHPHALHSVAMVVQSDGSLMHTVKTCFLFKSVLMFKHSLKKDFALLYLYLGIGSKLVAPDDSRSRLVAVSRLPSPSDAASRAGVGPPVLQRALIS